MAEDLGAVCLDHDRCRFRVWAPLSENVHVHVVAPEERVAPMKPAKRGYHTTMLEGIKPGARYLYRLADGKEFPDPVSRSQPDGVHGPSQVVNADFAWTDHAWFGIPLESYIICELHAGTFTPQGTFEAIIPFLDDLADTGFTAIELMPIAQFAGTRNWGYDGVYPFAVQHSYGGPCGLKRLVDACHARGVAVILDVVYNHIGPEGNYLPNFAPYFTSLYKTPWGSALNFDDAHSDEVRHFFITNALEWITDYHIDALRLDAVHAILDHSALNFLEELAANVRRRSVELNRRLYVIAESALNDTRIIQPPELGGYGLNAQWNDDFHHALHTLITKEREGYYVDFGDFQYMAQAFSEGFVYSGRYSANRGRRHGNSSRSVPPSKFVVFAQNHDQIGNRMMGERLSQLVSIEAYKLATAAVLLSPFIPLLFMGDEYGETAPFQYFVSHSDPGLIDAVRRGRRAEFSKFEWRGEPPDPQSEQTFLRSKLNHELKKEPHHRSLLAFHKKLMHLRKSLPALRTMSKDSMDVASFDEDCVLTVRRWQGNNEVVAIFNFRDQSVNGFRSLPSGRWKKAFESAGVSAPDFFEVPFATGLTLQPYGVLLYVKQLED